MAVAPTVASQGSLRSGAEPKKTSKSKGFCYNGGLIARLSPDAAGKG